MFFRPLLLILFNFANSESFDPQIEFLKFPDFPNLEISANSPPIELDFKGVIPYGGSVISIASQNSDLVQVEHLISETWIITVARGRIGSTNMLITLKTSVYPDKILKIVRFSIKPSTSRPDPLYSPSFTIGSSQLPLFITFHDTEDCTDPKSDKPILSVDKTSDKNTWVISTKRGDDKEASVTGTCKSELYESAFELEIPIKIRTSGSVKENANVHERQLLEDAENKLKAREEELEAAKASLSRKEAWMKEFNKALEAENDATD